MLSSVLVHQSPDLPEILHSSAAIMEPENQLVSYFIILCEHVSVCVCVCVCVCVWEREREREREREQLHVCFYYIWE
jgi:heme/copper-type cytochrome/quinol oxidase subunit 2